MESVCSREPGQTIVGMHFQLSLNLKVTDQILRASLIMDTVSSPAPWYQQGLFQWLLLLKHSTCMYQKKSNNILLCHSVTDAYFEVNSDFF